ncbi:MAG TPA: phenylalanine--tRNA ligase subunit alpha, partial [Desulfobacteraceae bacterium]|nr:phenylalanine--tRNA ligase subunit alpha [Desulfobacteraceae bacterium]
MNKHIEQIQQDFLESLNHAKDAAEIQTISVQYLGRKGLITLVLKGISQLPKEERPGAGKKANQVRITVDKAIQEALQNIATQNTTAEDAIDVSLPGRSPLKGSLHPVSQIQQEICDIFSRLGFDVAEGPEVESDYYNFEALNFPKNHPARDMQDTFFVSDDIVLRTHTSPLQIRIMEKTTPPVRVVTPGKVFRCDSD